MIGKDLEPPDEVRAATEEYRCEQDTLTNFLTDCCISKSFAKTPASDLFAAYRKWSQDNGEEPKSQVELGKVLIIKGFKKIRGTGGRTLYEGIGLLDTNIGKK